MAGQPRWHAFLGQMAEVGEDAFFDHLADGGTVAAFAERYKVSRRMVMRWVQLTEARFEKYRDAKRERASAHADQALAIADGPGDPQDKKVKIDARRWLAGVDDRKQFGERPAAGSTVVNIGTLHLDALRARGGPEALPQLPTVRSLPAITDAVIEVETDGIQGREQEPERAEQGQRASGGDQNGAGDGAHDQDGGGRADHGGTEGLAGREAEHSGREPEGQSASGRDVPQAPAPRLTP